MGTVQGISFDSWPRQGSHLHRRVRVCFNYDAERTVGGICIRDDAEPPGLTIFRLDDGRVVLATECQYQPEAPETRAPQPTPEHRWDGALGRWFLPSEKQPTGAPGDIVLSHGRHA